MKTAPTTTRQTVWTCPTCGRQFRHTKQVHSCTYYPIEKHLAGKSEHALALYDSFIKQLRLKVGEFSIESLPCCIHLVHNVYTFAAVYVMRDKIRLHILAQAPVDDPRAGAIFKMSDKRFAYSVDISNLSELDDQLFEWMRQSYLPSIN